jgi:hypothetical protein
MKHYYTNEQLETTVKESSTWTEVCRKLGVKPMSGSQTHLKNKAVKLGIDYSHFIGKSYNKGRSFPTKRPIEDYLSNKHAITSGKLRVRLIKEGIKQSLCERCGMSEWMGSPIPLELDHINSDHFDNSLNNLQILCPNCHALKTMECKRSN